MKMKRILTYLLTFSLLFGLLPTAALAAPSEEGGVSTLTEKSVEVSSWNELTQAVQELSATECLKATITASLYANSKLDLNGKTVVLTTDTEGISIKRTLKSGANSVDPIFNLKNGGSLTIDGGENEITLTDNNENRTKSKGLIYADSGTTVSLSKVSFADFKFGKSTYATGYGAVYATGATVTMSTVTMTDCIGGDGVLLYANNSKAELSNCTVTKATYYGNQNSTGGVIRVTGSNSNVTISNCEIKKCGSAEANQAANSCGPVWLEGGTVKISSSTISENVAMIGSGIMAENTNLTLTDVNVTNNICRGDGYDTTTGEPNKGNVTMWQGAGLYIEDCTLTMSNVKITGNTGSFIGGGMCVTDTNVTLDDTIEISGNSAVCGGGIYTQIDDAGFTPTVTLNGAKVKNNTAVKKDAYASWPLYNGCGGGIANNGGSVVLNNAEISGNTADAHGGGIMNLDTTTIKDGSITGNKAGVNDDNGLGGGICIVDESKVHAEGSTSISDNSADFGNAVYVDCGSTFEIQDSVAIDKGNDVGLGGAHSNTTEGINIPSAYITVSAPFTGATKENPIRITSEDKDVEDLKADPATEGTLIVNYTEDAGGILAALKADLGEIFVSTQNNLLIGRSQKENQGQWLTYVKERNIPNYDVTYKGSSTKQQTTEKVPYGTQIAIDPNGGTLDWQDPAWDNTRGSEKQTLTVTGSITVPDPAQSGHTFLGWEETNVEGVLTLTAQWKKNSSGGGGSTTYYYFALEKIDAQDSHTLNGAKFGLYLDGKQIATATSNSSGIATFRVDTSDYRKITTTSSLYYQELTAPEGYVLSSDKINLAKSDLVTSQTTAEKKAETVRNYRSSTPDQLNDTDHFAYVIGYEDGTVRPNSQISRAETATIFFRLLKDSVRDGNLLTSNTYTDVADSYWANTAISTMTGLGIVQGRSSTTFDPQAPITRAEFAAICARFDTGTSSGAQTFSDISGHWAEKYIQRAAELGWIKGFEDGSFRPDTYITRAQAMTMVNRVLNRIPEETSDLLSNMNVWPDCNPSDWFYLAVQEATNSHDYKHKAGNYETWTGMKTDPDWTRYEK